MSTIFLDLSLSHRCIQTVLGGLLGDGSLKIQKGYRNARYQIRHSRKQKEYLEWKQKQLYEIALPKLQVQKSDGFSKEEKIGLQSQASKELTKIHAIVCKDNNLLIQRNWLNLLNELALLVWWLDDGSLIANRKQGCFCTDGFSFKTIELLQQYLLEVWKIYTKIGSIKRKQKGTKVVYYRLYLNNTELRKLFDLIMPYLEVGSMVRKFTLVYKDFGYQKRWICTMKQKMPEEMHKSIDLWYKKI